MPRSRTNTWAPSLRVGLEDRTYNVELQRQIGCCSETYRLFVNEQEMEDHGLTYNAHFPFCGSGGKFQFDRDGHQFLLAYDPYSWETWYKDYRLFIDGIDVNSGLEYSAFWRRRGWQAIGFAAVWFVIALIINVALTFALGWHPIYLAYTSGLIISFVLHFAFGLSLIMHTPSATAY